MNITCSVYDESLDALASGWTNSGATTSTACQIESGTSAFRLYSTKLLTTADYDVSTGCEQIEISFKLKGESSSCYNGCYNGIWNNYRMYVEYSTNGGTNWSNLKSITYGSSYQNWQTITESLNIGSATNVQFRIRSSTMVLNNMNSNSNNIYGCTGYASGYQDWFIDEIVV